MTAAYGAEEPAQAATTPLDAARAALDEAEREPTGDAWRLTPRDAEAVRRVLEPLDALGAPTCAEAAGPAGRRGPDEEAALRREALAAVAVAVLHTEGGLRRLLSAVCAALEPLLHPSTPAWGDADPYGPEHRAEAERLLRRLRDVLHAALAAAHRAEAARLP
ncbi:hypothetical protein [Streptacidiphilus anmyonensis]|uniref:hypothetical protein n=1 Tax=Streptacidiphilus anmyonensis TaxID=405782 RepID=UPI0005AAFB1E|nr:hypothetical protein [Streptacidiphilus anmyonensis]